MRRANGASWNNKRPDGETFSFQRCGNLIEAEANMPSNILGNDPSRPDLSNKAIHLRPEMSFIFFATPSSCHAERLARVSAANKLDCAPIPRPVERAHVLVDRHVRPMPAQDGAAVRFNLAKSDGSHSCGFESEGESANS
jgi:hypothetical protein